MENYNYRRLPERLGESVFLNGKNGYRYLVLNVGKNKNHNPITERLKRIKRDYDESMEEYRAGKLKGYSSTKEMWEDLEKEGYI